MNDPRTEAVATAVRARYPEATITIEPCVDPASFQIPLLIIAFDAVTPRIRDAENYAIELTLAACAGEAVPHVCLAFDRVAADEYFRSWLQPAAKA